MSRWLITVLAGTSSPARIPERVFQGWVDAVPGNSAEDEDAQLALHSIYELSYRGFADVDDDWEWNPDVLALRRLLEARFELDLRCSVAGSGLLDGARTVDDPDDPTTRRAGIVDRPLPGRGRGGRP